MKRIFLGPLVHWALIVVLIGLGWFAGLGKTHVSQFNTFMILLIVVTIAILVVVLRSSPPGRQITRDPLHDIQSDGD